jgi:hypothetical protein
MRTRFALILFFAASCSAVTRAFILMPMTLHPVMQIRAAGPPAFSLGVETAVRRHVAAPGVSVKRCTELADWSAAAAAQPSGLLVPRPLRALAMLADVCMDDVQACVERAASGIEAQHGLLACARIPIGGSDKSRALQEKEVETLQSMHEILLVNLQQPEIVQLLMDDMKSLCAAMKEIADGKCNGLEVKIELIGANSCRKWHHDHFVGRSIITYSGKNGTTFCNSPETSVEEIVKSDALASVESAEIGDILFIKGAKYDANGGW